MGSLAKLNRALEEVDAIRRAAFNRANNARAGIVETRKVGACVVSMTWHPGPKAWSLKLTGPDSDERDAILKRTGCPPHVAAKPIEVARSQVYNWPEAESRAR